MKSCCSVLKEVNYKKFKEHRAYKQTVLHTCCVVNVKI